MTLISVARLTLHDQPAIDDTLVSRSMPCHVSAVRRFAIWPDDALMSVARLTLHVLSAEIKEALNCCTQVHYLA